MSHRNHQIFPHPVLSPQRQDYVPDCRFAAQTPHTVLSRAGQHINITLKYQLQSPFLRALIAENKATYLAVIECTPTYQRQSFPSRDEDDVLVLSRREWQDTLLLTPYIAATTALAGFASSEHSPLVRALAPQGLDLPAGAILAIGASIVIELEEEQALQSIFDIVPNRALQEGTFSTDLSGERIAINIHPDGLGDLQNIRDQARMEPLLHQALYLHALHKALLYFREYTDKRWAQVLERRLEEQGIPVSDELEENAEIHAQQLFALPLARMLDTLNQEMQDE